MFGHPPGMYTVRGDRGGPPGSQGRATPEQRGDAQGGGYSGGGAYSGRSVWTQAEETIILEGVATVGRPQHRLAPPGTACTTWHS